jgi:hypothetical protein
VLSLLQLDAMKLTADDRSLDRGVLTYQLPGTLEAGELGYLSVTVTDIGKHPKAVARVVAASAQRTYSQNVPTGSFVAVRATCDGLTCQLLGPAQRPVLAQGDSATWNWTLTAHNAGVADIFLVAITYDLPTGKPLNVTSPPVKIPVVVRAAPRPSPSPTTAPTRHAPHPPMVAKTVSFIDNSAHQVEVVCGAIVAIIGVILAWRQVKKGEAHVGGGPNGSG